MTGFRPYRAADKQACLAIFDGNVPDYFDNTERPEFAAFLDKPAGNYFVLERDGKLIGCGGYAREERGQARFTWGMIDRSSHGSGLGRLLASHRMQAIEDAGGYREVELFTTPLVAPFFEKLGFERREVAKDGFAPGMDRVQMIRPL